MRQERGHEPMGAGGCTRTRRDSESRAGRRQDVQRAALAACRMQKAARAGRVDRVPGGRLNALPRARTHCRIQGPRHPKGRGPGQPWASPGSRASPGSLCPALSLSLSRWRWIAGRSSGPTTPGPGSDASIACAIFGRLAKGRASVNGGLRFTDAPITRPMHRLGLAPRHPAKRCALHPAPPPGPGPRRPSTRSTRSTCLGSQPTSEQIARPGGFQ